jgi:MoaA/NifB/PqqE/SkfB family radical SAM enzyme
MPEANQLVMRRRRTRSRRLREAKLLLNGTLDTDHPIMAHIIPIRRCNLACTYCNEYDDFSNPVPLATMERRIELLGKLRTGVITISGGEPLLHPQLDDVVRAIRATGAMAGLITNGFLINAERVRKLNDAGLDYLQISIDNVQPDDVSKKSLKTLDYRLQILAEHAHFHVNINSVLGGGIRYPEDALTVGKRAMELGFTSTVGIIHDGEGQLRPLAAKEREVFLEMKKFEKKHFSRLNHFQEAIADGRPSDWRCRAGSRYLYVCEDGLVHYCSQQRGSPAKPLEDYTVEDVRREYITKKSCATLCTVSCVHQISYFDFFRGEQTLVAEPAPQERLVSIKAVGA